MSRPQSPPMQRTPLSYLSWAALLLVAASAAVWLKHEDIVVRLLSEGLIDEQATRTLPETVRYAALATGIVGLVAAWRLALRGAQSVYDWTPAQRVAAPVLQPFGALLVSLWGLVRAVFLTTRNAIVAPPRRAWRAASSAFAHVRWAAHAVASALRWGATAIRQRLWLGISAIARPTRAAVWSLGQVVLLPPHVVSLVLAALARQLERGVSTVSRWLNALLGAVWQRVTSVAGNVWAAITAIARTGSLALANIAQALWRAFRLPPHAVWLVLAAAAHQLKQAVATVVRGLEAARRALWRQVTIVGSSLRLGVVTLLQPLWRAASTIVHAADAALRALRLAVASALRDLAAAFVALLGRVIVLPLVAVSRALATVARQFGRAAGTVSRWLQAMLDALWRGGIIALDYLRIGLATILRPLWRGLSNIVHIAGAVLRALRLAVTRALHDLAVGFIILLALFFFLPLFAVSLALAAVAHLLGRAAGTVSRRLQVLLDALWRAGIIALDYLRIGVATMFRPLWLAASSIVHAADAALRAVRLAVTSALHDLAAGFVALLRLASTPLLRVGSGIVATIQQQLRLAGSTLVQIAVYGAHHVRIVASPPLGHLWLGLRTAGLILPWSLSAVEIAASGSWDGCRWTARFAVRTASIAMLTVWDLGRAAISAGRGQKGASIMSEVSTRERMLSLIARFWVLGIGGFFLFGLLRPAPPEPTVVVMHWVTGHLTRDGLVPEMADRFNEEDHRMPDGTRIVVQVHNVPSQLQAAWLTAKVNTGISLDLTELSDGYVQPGYGEPTIVTPSSAHWLVTVNYEVGRELVDLAAALSIVRPVIGIVTYEEMARCLGWPEKELGFADILGLRADPEGWAKYDCAKAEWGQRPLVAYTDPATSSTGRSLLLALYAIAAGKLPQELTQADVTDPAVVGYVEDFALLVDHYLIGTTVLNTKIHQGPRYGHFFIMPEDNLIHLYEGTERVFINGKKVTAPPIDRRMVMIYPKEGSMPRSNCACIVQSSWVTEEQAEAAAQWTDYLLEDDQQRSFMAAGFRPGTDISLSDPSSKITSEFGLDPTKPSAVLNPALIAPSVAAAIDASWVDVKRPGIVTFVVDTSGSMMGNKLQQAQAGLIACLDAMAKNNQVGLLAFDETIHSLVPVGPLAQNRFALADVVDRLGAGGETALYDAIKAAIEMTGAADGDPDAIRAIVVLTDGRANRGETRLYDLVEMMSSHEAAVPLSGMQGETTVRDARGNWVTKESVIGTGLALSTRYPIQVFFIGIGDDADLDIGRILAQATSAEFQGVTEEDLANVLEEFSSYF